MNSQTLKQLAEKLEKIEKAAETFRIRRGYTKDVRNLKILSELIKEQIPNANTHSTAR